MHESQSRLSFPVFLSAFGCVRRHPGTPLFCAMGFEGCWVLTQGSSCDTPPSASVRHPLFEVGIPRYWYSGVARQTKPKKGPERKVHEFRPFFVNSGIFLGKTSMIHVELLFRNATGKSSWTGLSLVWFAGVTPEVRCSRRKRKASHTPRGMSNLASKRSSHEVPFRAFSPLSVSRREEKNGVLAKRGLCPLPKTGGFDENGENDEWTLYPRKQGLCSSDPWKRRKWRKWRKSRTQRPCL